MYSLHLGSLSPINYTQGTSRDRPFERVNYFANPHQSLYMSGFYRAHTIQGVNIVLTHSTSTLNSERSKLLACVTLCYHLMPTLKTKNILINKLRSSPIPRPPTNNFMLQQFFCLVSWAGLDQR